MKIEEMKQRKKELGYSFKQIAALSGVPLGTVQKIFNGETKAPRFETLEKLSALFLPKDSSSRQNDYIPDYSSSMLMDEPAIYGGNSKTIDLNHFNGKVQGQYTIEDYRLLPNDIRVELIDGHFFYMEAPTPRHQLYIGELFRVISNYIRDNKGKCIPFMAPTDVQLDCDDKTMVQPDVFVVCDPKKLNEKNLFGSPDFVAEVLSPSTSRKDRYIKAGKYKEAGVREYWMVDPSHRNVVIYRYDMDGNDDTISIYGFDQMIPVGIYNGNLMIDFTEISEYIEGIFGGVDSSI